VCACYCSPLQLLLLLLPLPLLPLLPLIGLAARNNTPMDAHTPTHARTRTHARAPEASCVVAMAAVGSKRACA
jgi:hypothetical protein